MSKNKRAFKKIDDLRQLEEALQTAPVSEPVVEEASTPSVGEVMEMKSEREIDSAIAEALLNKRALKKIDDLRQLEEAFPGKFTAKLNVAEKKLQAAMKAAEVNIQRKKEQAVANMNRLRSIVDAINQQNADLLDADALAWEDVSHVISAIKGNVNQANNFKKRYDRQVAKFNALQSLKVTA